MSDWTKEHHFTTAQQWAAHDEETHLKTVTAAKTRIRAYKDSHDRSDEWETEILEYLFDQKDLDHAVDRKTRKRETVKDKKESKSRVKENNVL